MTETVLWPHAARPLCPGMETEGGLEAGRGDTSAEPPRKHCGQNSFLGTWWVSTMRAWPGPSVEDLDEGSEEQVHYPLRK